MPQRTDLLGWSTTHLASNSCTYGMRKIVAVLSRRLVPFLLRPLHHYDPLLLSSPTWGEHAKRSTCGPRKVP